MAGAGRQRAGCFAAIDGEKQTFVDRAGGQLPTTLAALI
jgi:hypothetical protein